MKNYMYTDPDSSLWVLLGMARHEMLKVRQKELSSYHITPRQANVLIIIHDLGEDATLTEISKHAYREIPSISVQISRMVEKGLLKKKRDTNGTNLMKFEITKKGLEIYNYAARRQLVHEIFSVISKEERLHLNSGLEKILKKSQEIYNRMGNSKPESDDESD